MQYLGKEYRASENTPNNIRSIHDQKVVAIGRRVRMLSDLLVRTSQDNEGLQAAIEVLDCAIDELRFISASTTEIFKMDRSGTP